MATLYGYVSNTGAPEYDDILNSDLPKEEKVKQIKMRGQEYRDEVDRQHLKDMAKLIGGAALEIGSAAIPIGAGARLAGGLAKGLMPYVGKKIAQEVGTGLVGGGLSGGVFGLGRGLMEDKNPLLTAGQDALLGTAMGGAVGYGAGQIGKRIAFKNLLNNPENTKFANYFDNYVDGLRDTAEFSRLSKAVRATGSDYLMPGSTEQVLYDILADEAGNPISFYHSTPKSGFTEFKPGSFFTKDAEYSKGYMNPNASALGFKKVTDSDVPGMYEVNLDFNNTFDTRKPIARDIFNKEYQAYYSPELSERGLPDWMEAEDLMEWLQNKHPEYDSLIVDEGGTGGGAFNQPLRLRGESYLPFKPEQVKIKKLYDKDGNIIKDFEEKTPQNLKFRDEWVRIDGKDYHILNLPKKDYGKIMHIIDTYIKPDDMIGEVITRNDDMYKYTFQKISPTDYKFIKRRKLK